MLQFTSSMAHFVIVRPSALTGDGSANSRLFGPCAIVHALICGNAVQGPCVASRGSGAAIPELQRRRVLGDSAVPDFSRKAKPM